MVTISMPKARPNPRELTTGVRPEKAVDRLAHPFAKKLQYISDREGEDAQLTGGTRSLHRRLLALNLVESPAAQVADSLSAAQTALSA